MRTIIVLLALWVIGVALAFWFGLGWFFLLETLRRIVMAIPIVYFAFLRIVVGSERANEERELLSKKNVRMFYVWRFIVALMWLWLTIVVFRYVNIRLVDLLH
jgi:hypothetical protein